MTSNHPITLGAILAGGLARRLGGGDKTLRLIGGRTVLDRLVDRVGRQVVRLIINANDDPMRFEQLGLPIVADSLPGHLGPLAGVLAALDWTAVFEPAIGWVVTVPGDAPFLPVDLVSRLHAARVRDRTRLACASSFGRTHPVIALWPVSIREELRVAIVEQNIRRIDRFTSRYAYAVEAWATSFMDPFFNVNTPDDLAEADRLLADHPGI